MMAVAALFSAAAKYSGVSAKVRSPGLAGRRGKAGEHGAGVAEDFAVELFAQFQQW